MYNGCFPAVLVLVVSDFMSSLFILLVLDLLFIINVVLVVAVSVLLFGPLHLLEYEINTQKYKISKQPEI